MHEPPAIYLAKTSASICAATVQQTIKMKKYQVSPAHSEFHLGTSLRTRKMAASESFSERSVAASKKNAFPRIDENSDGRPRFFRGVAHHQICRQWPEAYDDQFFNLRPNSDAAG
jgi:hypothetical protein